MSIYDGNKVISREVSTDGAIGSFIVCSSKQDGTVKATDGVGEMVFGVAQVDTAVGDRVALVLHGFTRAIAGATIANTDNELMVNASGQLIPLATGGGGTQHSVARIIRDTNAVSFVAGEEIQVLFTGGNTPAS